MRVFNTIDRQKGRKFDCKEKKVNFCLQLSEYRKAPKQESLLVKASRARGEVERSVLSSAEVKTKHKKEKTFFFSSN